MSHDMEDTKTEKPAYISRADILSKCDGSRRIGQTTIPNFGVVGIQNLFDEEKRHIEALDDGDFGKSFSRYAIACLIDDDGEPLFGAMHEEKLSKMDYALSRPIMAAIAEHCGVGPYTKTDEQLKKS